MPPHNPSVYRGIATSLEGFIHQVATCYLRHGYWFYVQGVVPQGKIPEEIDRKLIAKYGIDVSKYVRARRKKAGRANVHYIRYGGTFLLLATHGEHPFHREERGSIRDARVTGIRIEGYLIRVTADHSGKRRIRVQIDREHYRDLKAYFVENALHRNPERLSSEFWTLPFEPYAPVRRQLLCILRAVNKKRKEAGYEVLPRTVLRFQRWKGKVFAENGGSTSGCP